ncbi:copper resistance protein CopC [Catenovulum maritimum]|uniref:Copper resistance protein CopC n=1 Tax=Catenovulum maritimum TaxID=1513271 RepID=A0A0J8GVK0_9ALTE|nr:copper resistance CopC family protein [Catenovulum maritimum]KMT66767.1 copper resistance protein CopC [Catenovulum maritimum]
MKKLIKFLTVISVVFSSAVFAHVHLEKSVPADNAMLMKTPEKLALTFSKEVRVVKVTLQSKKGEKVKFGFKPSKEASSEFTWKLPKLAPANYVVDVTFLGKDGHKMKDSFSFMVH